MARKAGGADQLASARELLRTAKTADELRTAQAVLLPLELGLSLEQTAKAIGRSVGATCNLRTRYCKVARHERNAPRSKRALRNRANTTLEREAQIVDEVLEGAMRGGVVVVPPLKEKVEERLGKPVALSTIYRMLDIRICVDVPCRSEHMLDDNPWLSRKRAACLIFVLSGVGIVACTTFPIAQNMDAQHWKVGTVHKIVDGKDITDIRDRECVAALSDDEIKRSRFAVVRYSKGRGYQNRTVQIPDSSNLMIGDLVRINLIDCGQSIIRESD